MSSNHQLFISFTNFYSNTHMLWTTHSSSTVEYRPSVAATLRLLPRNWVKVIPILGSCMRSSICLRLSRSEGGRARQIISWKTNTAKEWFKLFRSQYFDRFIYCSFTRFRIRMNRNHSNKLSYHIEMMQYSSVLILPVVHAMHYTREAAHHVDLTNIILIHSLTSQMINIDDFSRLFFFLCGKNNIYFIRICCSIIKKIILETAYR